MAKYLVLIYGSEQRWDEMPPRQRREIDEGHRRFRERAGDGVLASGQLESTSTTTTLRAGSGGRPMVVDGPFAETKEAVGGFYVLEAADLDEAISLVSDLAEVSHDHSGVEITPLVRHG